MKFTLLGLCALSIVAAAESPADTLEKLSLDGRGIIKLTPETFDLLTSPKRTWSASIQLTALDSKRRCQPCQTFNPAWNAVAKAWSTVVPKHRKEHFFATIDFDDAPSVFQKLGIASAPIVYNYPAAIGNRKPASGKTSPVKYDFSDGFDAGPLAEYISKYTPIPVPYSDPIDWSKWITVVAGISVFGFLLRFISPLVRSKYSWALGTALLSLVMTSGFMFTRIRNVPFNGPDGSWIAGGYQNQYGQEVQVISFIYGLLSFSFLMLILVVPKQASPQRQRLQVYLWTGVILIIYSVLISLFRVKNRGYPFKLFL